MEQQGQSEYTLIRRTAAVPVRRASEASETAAAVQESTPKQLPKRRIRLSGEGKLLLLQTAAGGVLLGIAVLGSALGGAGFRAAYENWISKNAVDLPSLVEPMEPEADLLPGSDPNAALAQL